MKVDGTDGLVFADNVTVADTITRSTGDWITDGFEDGQRISIVGSLFNDASFRVITVTGKVLTLAATETLANESAGVASVEVRGHGNGIEGTLVITDTSKPPVGNVPLTTTWTRIGDDVQVSDNAGGSTVLTNTRSASYDTLGLVSFLTIGDDEIRAWSVPHGLAAQKAAGTIHTDFYRGFIRAEVIPYDDLVRCGSIAQGRKEGVLRSEGKTYPVQDGDVIDFLINV